MNTTIQERLAAYVRCVAEDIKSVINGELYAVDGDFVKIANIDKYKGEYEPERVDIYSYFDKYALEVKWTINSRGECVGGKVLRSWGGPNIWCNESGVYGAWGSDRFAIEDSEIGERVLDYLCETMPK